MTLKNFQFRSLTQGRDEAFTAFCNRVDKEAKHCEFKCGHNDCTAEDTAIRDQIIIGLISNKIREEALKNSWNITQLRQQGMRIESATHGAAELSGDGTLNKLGRYSFKNQKGRKSSSWTCFFCGQQFDRSISIDNHVKSCRAKTATCNNCKKVGHYEVACRSKNTRGITTENSNSEITR